MRIFNFYYFFNLLAVLHYVRSAGLVQKKTMFASLSVQGSSTVTQEQGIFLSSREELTCIDCHSKMLLSYILSVQRNPVSYCPAP